MFEQRFARFGDHLAGLHQPVVQVLSRAEALAGAGDQQRAAALVAGGLVDRGGQRLVQCRIEGVEPLRPVQRDDAIAVAFVDQNCHGAADCGSPQFRSMAENCTISRRAVILFAETLRPRKQWTFPRPWR
jgi:hypothetical protein